ncbi:MAG TPA: hypothetical protein VLM75_03820 [Spirochaetota bacterium]|nr:hypothetical protein [Spirochaetota bacterium]
MFRNSITGAVVFSIFMLAVFTATCGKKEPGYFRDRAKGFSVVFPDDWEIKTEGLLGATVVQALGPLEEKGDLFRENVNISVENLSKDVGLQYYREMTFDNIAKALSEFRETERTEFTLDGRKAVMTVFTHRAGALRLKVLLCLVVERHRGYVLVCTATEKSYPAFKETFFKIMRSLKLEG